MKLRLLALLTVLPALSGCFLFPSAPVNPPTPLTAIDSKLTLSVQWRDSPGALNREMLRPAVVGRSIYAAAANGTITRWDEGREVWSKRPLTALSGGLASDGKVVIAAGAKGELLALDAANGDLRWSVNVGNEISATPLIAGQQIIVRAGDASLLAYALADGKRNWIYQRTPSSLSLRAFSGFTLAGEQILAGFPGGKLVAVSQGSGFPRWEASIAVPRGANELERMSDVIGDAQVRGGSACAAAFQGRVACVAVDTGAVQWTRDISTAAGVVADAKNIYVTEENGAVYALDLRTGATAWRQDRLLYRGTSGPLLTADAVVVGDALGWIHTLDRDTGRLNGRLEIGGKGLAAPMATYAEGFIVQTRDGRLHAISIR